MIGPQVGVIPGRYLSPLACTRYPPVLWQNIKTSGQNYPILHHRSSLDCSVTWMWHGPISSFPQYFLPISCPAPQKGTSVSMNHCLDVAWRKWGRACIIAILSLITFKPRSNCYIGVPNLRSRPQRMPYCINQLSHQLSYVTGSSSALSAHQPGRNPVLVIIGRCADDMRRRLEEAQRWHARVMSAAGRQRALASACTVHHLYLPAATRSSANKESKPRFDAADPARGWMADLREIAGR